MKNSLFRDEVGLWMKDGQEICSNPVPPGLDVYDRKRRANVFIIQVVHY